MVTLARSRRMAHSDPIGIPRALYYFLHPGLWETFFEAAGHSVILSAPTGGDTLERAGVISEPEHCLPVKLLDAHLDALSGKVDWVFVPRIFSMRRGHIACPKLSALPDTAQAQFGDRFSILTIEVDERRRPLARTLDRLGGRLGLSGARRRTAIARAEEALAVAWRPPPPPLPARPRDDPRCFLLIGHPYNLYDDHVAELVCSKLHGLGVRIERVAFDRETMGTGPLRWDTCSMIFDAVRDTTPETCAGVIALSSFNCGCDSIAGTLFREVATAKGIPFMTLVLDEHSARAGIDTRLEAFVDSIGQRP